MIGVVAGVIIGAAAEPSLARIAAAWELPCPWYYSGCPGAVPIGAAFSFNWTSSNHSGSQFRYFFDVRNVTSPELTGGGTLLYADLMFTYVNGSGATIPPDGNWIFTLTDPNLTISATMGEGFPGHAMFGNFPVVSGQVWAVTESIRSLGGGSLVVAGTGAFAGTVGAKIP